VTLTFDGTIAKLSQTSFPHVLTLNYTMFSVNMMNKTSNKSETPSLMVTRPTTHTILKTWFSLNTWLKILETKISSGLSCVIKGYWYIM